MASPANTRVVASALSRARVDRGDSDRVGNQGNRSPAKGERRTFAYKVRVTSAERKVVDYNAEKVRLEPAVYLRAAGLQALRHVESRAPRYTGLSAEGVRQLAFVGLALHTLRNELRKAREQQHPLNWHRIVNQLSAIQRAFDQTRSEVL